MRHLHDHIRDIGLPNRVFALFRCDLVRFLSGDLTTSYFRPSSRGLQIDELFAAQRKYIRRQNSSSTFCFLWVFPQHRAVALPFLLDVILNRMGSLMPNIFESVCSNRRVPEKSADIIMIKASRPFWPW